MFLGFLRTSSKAITVSLLAAAALFNAGCADAIPQLTSLLSSKAQPSGLQYAVLKDTTTQTIVAPQSTVGFSKISYTIDIDEASVDSYRYQLVEASAACPSVATGMVVSSDSGFSTSIMPTVISFRLCLWVTTKPGITPALVDSLSEQEWSISPQVKVIAVHGSDGAFGLGSLLNLTLRFSGPVYLPGGSPRLDLSIAGREALFLSAAGSDLLFSYTVAAGDLSNDLDVDFVNLYGASIVDSFGEAVDISIPAGSSLASLYNTQIDAVPPLTPNLELAGVMLNPSSNVYPEFLASNLTTGEYLWFIKGTCSDAVTATWTASGSTQTIEWIQAFGALPEGSSSFVVKAVDAFGNSTCSNSVSYTLNTTPVLTISSSPSSYVGMMNLTPRQIQIAVRDINGLSMDDFISNIGNVAQFFRGGVDAGCNIISESGSGSMRSLSVAQCQGDGNIDLTLPAGAVVSSRGVASSLTEQSAVLIADNTEPVGTTSWTNYVSPFFNVDRSSPTLEWSSVTDGGGSGVESIYLSAGTSGGLDDIYTWTVTGGSSAAFNPGAFLFGNKYYMNFKVKDVAGNESNTSSDMWRHHCRDVGFCNQAFLKSVNSITNEFTQESLAGTVVKQSGNYLAVGAPRKKVSGYPDAGAIYFYELRINGWFKVGELLNPSPSENRFFGNSLAFDGDKLIVGAPGDASNPGAVFLFKYTGVWELKSRTNYNLSWAGAGVGLNGQYGDLFGHALDYSSNTSQVIVGSPGTIQRGRADLFQVDWDNYTLTWITGYTGLNTLINVGYSVAISADGSTAVAGAPRASVVDNIYIFTNMSNWSAPIAESSGGAGTGFGTSVSISASGARIVVGSPLSDKVYIYDKSGGSYIESFLSIENSFYNQSSYNERFGDAVLLSPSGGKLYIGATQSKISYPTGPYPASLPADFFGSTSVGAVFEYEFNGSSWAPKSHFRSSGGDHTSRFGHSLALKPNSGHSYGNLLFVGAPEDNTVAQIINSSIIPSGISGPSEYNRAGAVHVFASEPEN